MRIKSYHIYFKSRPSSASKGAVGCRADAKHHSTYLKPVTLDFTTRFNKSTLRQIGKKLQMTIILPPYYPMSKIAEWLVNEEVSGTVPT
jgi:hypothetical protein